MRPALLLLPLMMLPGLAGAAAPHGANALQSAAPLVAQAEALLRDRAAAYPGSPEITVAPPRITRQAACDDLSAFLPGAGGLKSRTTVGLRCDGPQRWTLYVHANVRIIGSYFVANRQISRGETLSLDELDVREGDLLRNRRLINDPTHIIGWVADRRIPAGAAIQTSALRDPSAIERGHEVRTLARGIGFVASGQGQALESGRPGAQIQVRASSGEIITGTVIDAHTVQVMM